MKKKIGKKTKEKSVYKKRKIIRKWWEREVPRGVESERDVGIINEKW